MKKQKIALICAYPAGTNSGMISVDSAFQTVISNLKNVEFIRFCPWRSLSKGESLNYERYYSAEQLNDFDKIIFWGDFMHWIGYGKHDWAAKSKYKTVSLSQDEMLNLWYELCLLENREDLQKKSILFGGTLYGLDASQLLDKRYFNALTSLLNNSILVKTRDVQSANFVTQLAMSKKNVFGCDCSLLFQPYYFSKDKTKNKKKYLLYSFARSGKNQELESISKSVAKDLNLEAILIPWISKGAGLPNLEKYVNLINDAEFIITDIYHLTLNSWRDGTPAICIGEGNSKVQTSLSDKKKEIFYHQSFAMDYYFFLDNFLSNKHISLQVKNLINDKKSQTFITNYIRLQASRSLDDLLAAIKS